MARRIQSEQELLDLINHKPSKRKKIAIAVLVIAMILAMIIVIVVQIHKSNKFKEEVLEAKTALANAEYSDAVKKFDIVIKKDNDLDFVAYVGKASARAADFTREFLKRL